MPSLPPKRPSPTHKPLQLFQLNPNPTHFPPVTAQKAQLQHTKIPHPYLPLQPSSSDHLDRYA